MALGGLLLSIWIVLSPNDLSNPNPSGTGGVTPVTTPSSQAQASKDAEAAVAKDFLAQVRQVPSEPLTVKETVVKDDYALQVWGTTHTGGQAVLKYNSSTKTWTLLSMGGGAWSAATLSDVGVPLPVANELVTRAEAYWKK